MQTIQWVGLAMLAVELGALIAMIKPRTIPAECLGCGEVLAFDFEISDYPEACGECMSEVYETARREMNTL